jgi:hypothetical protein
MKMNKILKTGGFSACFWQLPWGRAARIVKQNRPKYWQAVPMGLRTVLKRESTVAEHVSQAAI